MEAFAQDLMLRHTLHFDLNISRTHLEINTIDSFYNK